MEWEYQVNHVNGPRSELESVLNALGKQRWELVQVISLRPPVGMGSDPVLFWALVARRPVKA